MAIISRFLAMLSAANTPEHNTENPTMAPSPAFCEWIKYKATIERLGKTEDRMICKHANRFASTAVGVKRQSA